MDKAEKEKKKIVPVSVKSFVIKMAVGVFAYVGVVTLMYLAMDFSSLVEVFIETFPAVALILCLASLQTYWRPKKVEACENE